MEIRRYGGRALLVTPARLAPRVDHPDVVDVVPGAATVLVTVRDATRLDAVRAWLEALDASVPGSADTPGRDVLLDVVYDGDDLADVAEACGLTADEVIERHAAATYRCDFCGFAPGFAYLSGLDERLHVPRRATPRPSVPAGSVAIAGPYSAVYPTASPGGWHLLGHTDATLWDLDGDPPALITAGTTVRFNPIRAGSVPNTAPSPPRSRGGTNPAQIEGRAVLHVVNGGVATSVQDHGRPGYAHLGVPTSGGLDADRHDLVNRLVGNAPDAAVVETAGGLVLEAVATTIVADSTTSTVQFLSPGTTLTVQPADGEVWAYLAVRGGIAVEPVLGSRSWDSLSRLGPSPLHAGSMIGAGPDPGSPLAVDQAPRRHPADNGAAVVREGPRTDWFAPHAFDLLLGSWWRVAAASRVGIRLAGPPLARVGGDELPSEGLVAGAIQVPPDGQPVVMLADHPTTGGYPVIGVVDEGDLARLAQHRLGSAVHFRRIDQVGR